MSGHPEMDEIEDREDILDAAKECVVSTRAEAHGSFDKNIRQLAKVWSARLNFNITPHEATLMLVDLKVTRSWHSPKHLDNFVDMAGYAALGGERAANYEGD